MDSTNNTPGARRNLNLTLALRNEVRQIERLLDRELAQWHGISLEDFVLLLTLFDTPTRAMTRSELADELGERITELVKRVRPLQRIGVIAEDDPVHKNVRTMPVTLSEAGATLVNDALVTANDVADGAISARRRDSSLEPLRELLG